MDTQEEHLLAYRRTISVIAVVIVLYLSFMIIRPFLVAIIGAAVLAYLFYPVYKYFLKCQPAFLPAQTIASVLTCLLIVLVVLIPMVVVSVFIAREAKDGYLFLEQLIKAPDFKLALPPAISARMGEAASFKEPLINLGNQMFGWLQEVVKSIPGAIFNVFVTIFSVYFFLKGGKNINAFIQAFFPLPEGRYEQIFSRFDDLSRGMIMGQIVVGLIQGVLAWLAFFLLGVPNPVLWGSLTAIISVIPLLGAALVWFPIAVYLFMVGYMTGIYWKAFVLLFFGMFVISTVDNILKPKIVGDRARVNPLIILFGILGGIQLVGIPGILLGPMILMIFDVIMEMFRDLV